MFGIDQLFYIQNMLHIPQIHESTFIRVEGVFPSGPDPELFIAKVARCSYGAQPKTKKEDERLIGYLQRHKHTSPFEFVNITFFLENIPLFVAVQLLRHRTGKFNMKSHRYTESHGACLDIQDKLRGHHPHNKQSSIDMENASDELRQLASEAQESVEHTREIYHKLIDQGLAREVARSVLPEGELTSLYVQFDLNNLCKFLSLRVHSTAQLETQLVAKAMLELAEVHFPIVLGGLRNDMEGVFLSTREIRALKGEDVGMIGDEKRCFEDKQQKLSGAKLV